MPNSPTLRHILSADQFVPELTSKLFAAADEADAALAKNSPRSAVDEQLVGRTLYRLFYEPSTRTYESFGFAATHLGMNVLGTQSVEFSSVSKGETLEDTIRMISSYGPSMIVMRSATAGDAALAAAVSDSPIINAGDGKGEHPTQSLLDLYTIQRELGRTNGLNIVLGGDMANGRTARSLVKLLSKHENNTFTFVSPPTFEIGTDILKELAVMPALEQADVVYWTRVQKERLNDSQTKYLTENPTTGEEYSLGLAEVSRMKKSARLLHPLPRIGEIRPEVDADPRAAYFRQARNGMLVRMALIKYVLGYL
jgi:aspartate carbamoyltransferase catalytic subunit